LTGRLGIVWSSHLDQNWPEEAGLNPKLNFLDSPGRMTPMGLLRKNELFFTVFSESKTDSNFCSAHEYFTAVVPLFVSSRP